MTKLIYIQIYFISCILLQNPTKQDMIKFGDCFFGAKVNKFNYKQLHLIFASSSEFLSNMIWLYLKANLLVSEIHFIYNLIKYSVTIYIYFLFSFYFTFIPKQGMDTDLLQPSMGKRHLRVFEPLRVKFDSTVAKRRPLGRPPDFQLQRSASAHQRPLRTSSPCP